MICHNKRAFLSPIAFWCSGFSSSDISHPTVTTARISSVVAFFLDVNDVNDDEFWSGEKKNASTATPDAWKVVNVVIWCWCRRRRSARNATRIVKRESARQRRRFCISERESLTPLYRQRSEVWLRRHRVFLFLVVVVVWRENSVLTNSYMMRDTKKI